MRLLSLVLVLFIGVAACSKKKQPVDQYVVMLSMDGFRWDYTQRVHTPNFDRIAREGVKATLIPSFPTKTFPNHYSIATGLYPDHHGIVMNSFYDEPSGRYYAIANTEAREDGYFYEGEPIWVTAEKQGIVSGSYYWVGAEAEIKGHLPTYTKKYDHDFPYGQRIDSIIAWLQKPVPERPRLVMWYFDEPDYTGHVYGPDSPELDSLIVELDSLLGVFLGKLEKLPIADHVNVIVTSDHGMANVSNERKVVLEENLNLNWVRELQGGNPNFNILLKDGYIDSAYHLLAQVEGIHLWKRGQVPDRLHYGTHERTLDLIVLADSSWSVVAGINDSVSGGTHGYDNANTDMHTIFYAFGPAFRKDVVSPAFNNVDIYPLICKILALKPAAVDGELQHVLPLLRDGIPEQ
jgi:alkaline phosphatase D